MAASGRLGVGIIGYGRIGHEHAGWLATAAGIHAVTAADSTSPRRDLAAGCGLRVFESSRDLLEAGGVDAVLVSSPTAMHFEHASAALSAGKHVMVEKPMALDLPQSRALVEQARTAGRVLSVFHNRRWDVDYLTLKRAVDAGDFGTLINVESRIGQWASCVGPAAKEWRPAWRNEAAFGGGGLYDWGSHLVDQLWRLMERAPGGGRPVRVFAQLRGNVWTTDCDDFARVCVDFEGGAVGVVEVNTTTTRPLPRWHVDGTAGTADAPHSPTFDLETWARVQFTPAEAPAESHPLARAAASEVLSETQIWARFANAVRDRDAEPAVTAESVLATMELLDAARESSWSGSAVAVCAG